MADNGKVPLWVLKKRRLATAEQWWWRWQRSSWRAAGHLGKEDWKLEPICTQRLFYRLLLSIYDHLTLYLPFSALVIPWITCVWRKLLVITTPEWSAMNLIVLPTCILYFISISHLFCLFPPKRKDYSVLYRPSLGRLESEEGAQDLQAVRLRSWRGKQWVWEWTRHSGLLWQQPGLCCWITESKKLLQHVSM